jgi:RimJ/RimL family protein N-acetyltransferase
MRDGQRSPVMDRADLQRAPRQLGTARLRLESPRLEHAPAVLEAVNASLHELRFVAWAHEAVDRIWADEFSQRGARFVEQGDALIYYVFERADGAFVGIVDLHTFDYSVPCCQIGYVADVRRAGRGLMREAALALMANGFALGLTRVEAWCDVRNARSIRFAECLGMQREGVRRVLESDTGGEAHDEMILACLRPDAAVDRAPRSRPG